MTLNITQQLDALAYCLYIVNRSENLLKVLSTQAPSLLILIYLYLQILISSAVILTQENTAGMLTPENAVCLTPRVNFTNILRAAFLYKSVLNSFFVQKCFEQIFCTYCFCFVIFVGKRKLAKKLPIQCW